MAEGDTLDGDIPMDILPDHGDHETSFERLTSILHKDDWYEPILSKIETVTSVKREYLIIAVGFTVLISLLFGYAGQIICHLVGFIYPGILTLYVIESGKNEAAVQWLRYWMVFSFITVLEAYLFFILRWIPFYWLMKCLLLFWCLFDNQNGLNVLYKVMVYPFFKSIKDPRGWIAQEVTTPIQSAPNTPRGVYNLRRRGPTPK